MTKITLEDVAVQSGTVWVSDAQIKSDEWWTEAAALCRSAQAVIEAARKPYDGHGTQPGSHFNRCRVCDEPPSKHLTSCALAAHAKNEQGTGEGG